MTLEQQQLYRSMLNTIDFFSQRLHFEQIVHYGYKIFEDLTLPESAAIYTLNETGDYYVARESCGYEVLPDISFCESHHEFASKNGFLLVQSSAKEKYFEKEFLSSYQVDLVLPLIIENRLYGFIISKESDKVSGIKNREFLNRFKDLLNLSLEKADYYEKRQQMQMELNKRNFNLESFAQTMNILMTALDQKYIVEMCLDVVRELTASAVSSILLETRENYLTTAGYKDILHQNECFVNMALKEDAKTNQIVFHVERDKNKLEDIFESIDEFKMLDAAYVVLLVKERIIGCITLGIPVSEVPYDEPLLEQIESLARMMYIALNNANQYKVIKEERNKMADQLKSLKHLNRSISIINGADSLDELCQHVLDTLQYGFDVSEGFIWIDYKGQSCYKGIPESLDDKPTKEIAKWLKEQEHELVEYSVTSENPITGADSNCLVCIPILEQDYFETRLGYLVINKTKTPLDQGLSLIFKTLISSITPVVKQFLIIEEYQQQYTKTPEALLSKLYHSYRESTEVYHMPSYIYVKKRGAYDYSNLIEHVQIEFGDQLNLGCLSIIFANEMMLEEGYELLETNDFEHFKEQLRNMN